MTLTDDQRLDRADTETLRRHFREHGWVAVPDVYGSDEVDAVARLAADISSAELARAPEPSYTVDASGDGRLAPRKIDWPFLKHEQFRRFVLDPRLRRLVEALLGPDPCLVRDQLFMKPPRFGSPKPYHQENAPLLIEPPRRRLRRRLGGARRRGRAQRVPALHRRLPPGRSPARAGARPALRRRRRRRQLRPGRRGGRPRPAGQRAHPPQPDAPRLPRQPVRPLAPRVLRHWVTPTVTSSTAALDHAYSRRIGTQPLAFTCH